MSNPSPRIFLDAGHGGHDPGAVGPTGLRESDMALSVVLMMGAKLKQHGCHVIYSRTDDTFLELHQRATKANDAQANAFISIHCNSGPKSSGDGFEVFTTPGQNKSDELATELFLAYGAAFPAKRKRADLSDGDVDKEAGFAVLRRTLMPSCLFELEFIHTSAGENWLSDPANRAAAANALVAGALRYFKIPAGEPSARLADRIDGAILRELNAKLQALNEHMRTVNDLWKMLL